MRRRNLLQLGASWAVLPLVGCGGGAAEPAAPVASALDLRAAEPPPAAPTASASAAVETAAPRPPDPNAAFRESFTRAIGRIGKNHGHRLTLSFEEVKAGGEKTYDLRGAAAHPHTLTLSADDMKKLLAGEVLRTKSTTDVGHTHRVVVRCAPPVDPPEWVSVCGFTLTGKDEHEIVVTAAEMEAKVDKTYEIQGLAGHSHRVTIAGADFEKLAAGGGVIFSSTRDSDDQHFHKMEITLKKPAKT